MDTKCLLFLSFGTAYVSLLLLYQFDDYSQGLINFNKLDDPIVDMNLHFYLILHFNLKFAKLITISKLYQLLNYYYLTNFVFKKKTITRFLLDFALFILQYFI